jgi:hypothetical protein
MENPTAPPPEADVPLKSGPFFNLNALMAYNQNNDISKEIVQKVDSLSIDTSCFKCKQEMDKVGVGFMTFPCGHKIHTKCLKGPITTCSKCIQDIAAKEEEDIGIPLSYGTDPTVTSKINKKYHLDAITKKIKEIEDEGLNQRKITKIFGLKWFKLEEKRNVTFADLIDHKIKIHDLIDADVHAPTLAKHIGVTDFHQLKQLGLEKKHLKTKHYSIIYMKMLYNMDFKLLASESGLNLTIKDALKLCKAKPHYLLLLGLHMKDLMLHGLTIEDIIDAKDAFSYSDWISIGLNHDYVKVLEFRGVALQILGWNPTVFINDMELNINEMKEMKISATPNNISSSYETKKKKKKAIKS